ncbi:unnamed protein product [Oikopleura dioica]|uniref:Microtubule-associated protein n=1 Tax=Oikopleura dioica TaxID=34765 RepID=E4WU06_OIKDI|nr:unnamed protein product [Oikopleura dioica]
MWIPIKPENLQWTRSRVNRRRSDFLQLTRAKTRCLLAQKLRKDSDPYKDRQLTEHLRLELMQCGKEWITEQAMQRTRTCQNASADQEQTIILVCQTQLTALAMVISTNQFSGRSSPDRWSRGSRTNSRFSAVHPLSIRSHDEIFHTGPTKWTDQPIQSKVGSLDNFDHVAGGGDKDIHEIKYRFNAPNSISSRTKVIYGMRRDKMSADEQENGLKS